MDEVHDVDPIASLLLEETKSLNNGNFLGDASEEFNNDTLILLLGLGLEGEDVRLFQKHQIGLEKLITLTSSDLDYVGITSPEKKKNIMSCIRKLRKQQEHNSQSSNIISLTEYRSEDEQALRNVYRHQQTLIKILPCMKKFVTAYYEGTFFQTGISTNHTLEKVTLCCVMQANQTHQQLQLYLQELNEGVIPKHCSWLRLHRKGLFLTLIVGSCLSLAAWCFQK